MRTTHYPYSDEFLQLCDENGIVVIAEAKGISTDALRPKMEELLAVAKSQLLGEAG